MVQGWVAHTLDSEHALAGLATLAVDLDGVITAWSRGAEELFGLTSRQVLGRRLSGALLPADRDAEVKSLIAQAGEGQVRLSEAALDCADGTRHPIEVRWEALAGGVPAVLLTCRQQREPARTGCDDLRALLAEASSAVGSTLDLATTAREFLRVAVPRFADAAGLYLLERMVADDPFTPRAGNGSVEVRRVAVRVGDTDERDWEQVLPPEEVVVYPAGSPQARCAVDGASLIFARVDPGARARIEDRAALGSDPSLAARLLDFASFLAVPLTARGAVLGFVVFARRPQAVPFGASDVAVAEELARRAAVNVDNARLYRREHRTAMALQQSLLPVSTPAPAGLTIARRYLPAGDDATQVGGDWYDVIELPDGRFTLVMGDAMGHGTAAAAAMVQLRTAVRTLFTCGLCPAEVLGRLDQIARDAAMTQFATCLLVTCDPVSRVCVAARAGHLPPILTEPGGLARVIELPSGLPLGLGAGEFEAREFALPPGAVLVLFTDGLVERRDRDIETGIRQLCDRLGSPDASEAAERVHEMCDRLLAGLPGDHEDDVTLLAAHLAAAGAAPG